MRVRERKTMPRVTRLMAEQLLSDYTRNKRELAMMRDDSIPSTTPSYSLTSGVQSGNPEARPTEEITMTIVADARYIYLTTAIKSVEKLLHQIDSATQRLLYLVYMAPDPISISAAAVVVNQSQANAYRCVLQALTQLAIIAGYMPAP